MSGLESLTRDYRTGFLRYLPRRSEAALTAGYELGRRAATTGAGLLDLVLPLSHMQRGQMYLFASLPPAVFCFMIAEQYRQEPDKVASIVLLGNLASLVFVPLGLWMGPA